MLIIFPGSQMTRERTIGSHPWRGWRRFGEREGQGGRGAGAVNERSQPGGDGRGRVPGHSFTLDWWPGPELGMGRCHWAAGGDSHQSLLLLLCIYMFISLSIHNCSTFSQQVKNKGKSFKGGKGLGTPSKNVIFSDIVTSYFWQTKSK